MSKLLSGIVMLLLSSPVLSALGQVEEDAASAPSETVGMVWVALFAVIFFGMIGGFFWYLWHNEKKRTTEK